MQPVMVDILLPENLGEIFSRLDTVEEIINTALVCKVWKSARAQPGFQMHILSTHPAIEPRLRHAFERLLEERPEAFIYAPDTGLLRIDGAPWFRVLRFAHRFLEVGGRTIADLAIHYRSLTTLWDANEQMPEDEHEDWSNFFLMADLVALFGLPDAPALDARDNVRMYSRSYDDVVFARAVNTVLKRQDREQLATAPVDRSLVPPSIILALILDMVDEGAFTRVEFAVYQTMKSSSFFHRLVVANDLASYRRFHGLLVARMQRMYLQNEDVRANMEFFHQHLFWFDAKNLRRLIQEGDSVARTREFFTVEDTKQTINGVPFLYPPHSLALAAALGRVDFMEWAIETPFPAIPADDPNVANDLLQYPLVELPALLADRVDLRDGRGFWQRFAWSLFMPAVRFAQLAVLKLFIDRGLAPLWVLYGSKPDADGFTYGDTPSLLHWAIRWWQEEQDPARKALRHRIYVLLAKMERELNPEHPHPGADPKLVL